MYIDEIIILLYSSLVVTTELNKSKFNKGFIK